METLQDLLPRPPPRPGRRHHQGEGHAHRRHQEALIVGVVAILNITISSKGDNYTTKSALTSFFVDCSTSFMYRSNPNFSLATGTSAISLSTGWY